MAPLHGHLRPGAAGAAGEVSRHARPARSAGRGHTSPYPVWPEPNFRIPAPVTRLRGIEVPEGKLFAAMTESGWLSSSSRTGVAWRATVSDPEIAASFGIDIEKVRYLNFFIGSALAALAGVMVALLNNLVEPTMGAVPAYKGLAIIVLGGLGSVRGTLAASLALGVIESFGTIYIGHLLDRDAIAFAFLILVLMVRPQGLLVRR